jgi:hypothetical protein
MLITNERDRERVLSLLSKDTKKIIKSNKIKKPKGKRMLSLSV